MAIYSDKPSNIPIPERRLVRLTEKTGLTGTDLQRLQYKDSALTAAFAMASSTNKVELILINQSTYPIHLIEKCANYFILMVRGYGMIAHPGKMPGAQRPNYIGPLYNRIKYWAPFPMWDVPNKPNKFEDSQFDMYKLLDDIKNNRTNKWWTEDQLKMADELIRRRAVVY